MTPPAEPVVIRVLIADDQVLLRAGLRMLLDAEDDIEVVGEADDGTAAIELTRQLLPDVVVMDIRMPNVDGLAATRTIVADPSLASVHVVVLTTFDLDEYVFEAIRAGATGFLLKDAEPTELLRAIRYAASGESLLAPSVTRRLIAQFAASPEHRTVDPERARCADRARARDRGARRRRAQQRRDRRGAVHQPGDGAHPRQPGDDQAGRPRPRPTRRVRLRVRPRRAALMSGLASGIRSAAPSVRHST